MFSYLDGFVSICSQVKAMEIVNLVNTMFTTLDNLTDKHDVYKVTASYSCPSLVTLYFAKASIDL